MANENKEVRIGLGLDEASFRRVPTLIAPITTAFQNLARAANGAFGGMGGGGGGGGQQPFFPGSMGGGGGASGRQSGPGGGFGMTTQATQGLGGSLVQNLRHQQTALTTIASGSKEAMKAMVDATKRAMADQRSQLAETGREIDRLSAKYNAMAEAAEKMRGRAAATGDLELGVRAELASSHAARIGLSVTEKVGEAADRRQAIAELQRNERMMAPSATQRMGDVAGIGAAIAQGLARVLPAVGGAIGAYKGAADMNTAATMVTGNRVLGELARGDLRGLAELRGPQAQRILSRYGGKGEHLANAAGGVAGDIAPALGTIAGMTAAGAGVGAAAGAGIGAIPGAAIGLGAGVYAASQTATGGINAGRRIYTAAQGGLQAGEAQELEQALMLGRQMSPGRQLAFDLMEQHAGTRVHGAKALQGRHFQALGIGAGYGLSFDQSVGQAESLLAATGDIGQVMGRRGKAGVRYSGPRPGSRPGTSDLLASDVEKGYASGVLGVIPYGAKPGDLMPALSGGMVQVPGGDAGSFKSVTKGGSRGYMQLANDFMRMGISQEAAMGTLTGLGAGAQAQGTGRMQAPEVAAKQLEEVMARGIKKGFDKDVTSKFSEALGKTMAESAFGVGGAVGGYSERLQSLMAGLGPNASMRDIQAAGQGKAAIDQMTQQNQYVNMIQTAAGIRAIGPQGGGLKGRAMQMSTQDDMMGGSDLLTAVGVTPAERMSRLKETAKGTLATFDGKTKAERAAQLLMSGNAPNMEAATQMVSMLELQASGVFDEPVALTDKQRKGMKKGDLAESVFATQAKAIVEGLNLEKTEVAPLIKAMQKEGSIGEGLKEFLKNREMATGDFQKGNQYVVQVMSGPMPPKTAPENKRTNP